MKKRMSVIVLALLISMSMLSPVFATETITKTYKFNPKSKNDMSYNPSQEIKKGDKILPPLTILLYNFSDF